MGRRYLVWFWSGGGGGSQFAVQLAHRLSLRYGTDNVFLSLRADDPSIELASRSGVRLLTADVVSDRKRPLRTLADLNRGAQILQEHIRIANPDAVILAMNFAAAAPLSMTVDLPLIYCAHDPRPHQGDYAVRLQGVTQSFLVRRAAKVVALSGFAAGQLREQGVSAEKIVTLPLSSVFAPQPAVARAASEDVQFVFLGRMIAYKGLDTLARALRIMRAHPGWRLRIAGKGPALNDAMIAELACPQVEIVSRSWMKPDHIDQLLQSSDVLLAPYTEATQSGVVADALSWGVPVVATPVGALPEQLGHGKAGWLTKDLSPAAFADAMLAAIQDKSVLAAKAAGARRTAERDWSEDWWGWLDRSAVNQRVQTAPAPADQAVSTAT